jgi:hypothetical protein
MTRWISEARSRRAGRSSVKEAPERAETLERLVGEVESTRSPGEQRQVGAAMDAARKAARGVVLELGGHQRRGWRLPSTETLMAEFGRGLSGAGQKALREFIAEVTPAIESGAYGQADEAARVFAQDVGAEMAEGGWAPNPNEAAGSDSPEDLAALVPRG